MQPGPGLGNGFRPDLRVRRNRNQQRFVGHDVVDQSVREAIGAHQATKIVGTNARLYHEFSELVRISYEMVEAEPA